MKVGGWSQARYQRRVENAHANHAKEAIGALDDCVQDNIKHVILAGDPQMAPAPRGAHAEAPDGQVGRCDEARSERVGPGRVQATLERMREEDAKTDAEKVERLLR